MATACGPSRASTAFSCSMTTAWWCGRCSAARASRPPTTSTCGCCARGASQPELILREGSVADSCGEARIGTIQCVDVDADGNLVVLASLAGTAAAKNQVLLTGAVGTASAHVDFLKARLRKGLAKVVWNNGCLFTVDFCGRGEVVNVRAALS